MTASRRDRPQRQEFIFLEVSTECTSFSDALRQAGSGVVSVLEPFPQDALLAEESFGQAKSLVSKANHLHVTFSGGSVSCPADPLTGQETCLLEKAVALCLWALKLDGTVSFISAESSPVWQTKLLQRLSRRIQRQPFSLLQSNGEAGSEREIAVLTNAEWLTPDVHLAVSHGERCCNPWVSHANALVQWLHSSEGQRARDQVTYMRVGVHQNVLVRKSLIHGNDVDAGANNSSSQLQSRSQIREQENASCLGGLRDPRRAVARSASLRKVGDNIRVALDACLDGCALDSFEKSTTTCPFSEAVIAKARARLSAVFRAPLRERGFQDQLLQQLMTEAHDPDAHVVPKWMNEGFPLGISRPIIHTNVFPSTDSVSASIKASQAIGTLIEDWDGRAQNYKSFQEAGPKAELELDRLVADGRAELVASWQEVTDAVGPHAKLTKLACIIKQRGDVEKVRLLVDMRRSGINGLMDLRERIVLPRISDVADSLRHIVRDPRNRGCTPEFMIADFSDAFYTLEVHPDERGYIVVKGSKGFFLLKVICFGLACGPVLWGRVAAAIMRLGQAATRDPEGRVQCFVDDPLMIAMGKVRRDRTLVFARYTLFWTCLGFQLAWHKTVRGIHVDWIGVSLQLSEDARRMVVCLTADKAQKLLDAFAEIKAAKGMIATARLRQIAGLLSWVSNLMPSARPWTSMIWAAVHSAEGPKSVKSGTRQRKGLTFIKQILHAVLWLEAMVRATLKGPLAEASTHGPVMRHVYDFSPEPPVVLIQTDACPTGIGAVLYVSGAVRAWFSEPLTAQDMQLLGGGAQIGDPAYQTEFELWAVVLAIKTFGPVFHGEHVRFFLQTDNSAALQAALEFKAKSPLLTYIASELTVTLAAFNVAPLWGEHLPGVLNDVADALSRGSVPAAVTGSPRCEVPPRARDLFWVLPSLSGGGEA